MCIEIYIYIYSIYIAIHIPLILSSIIFLPLRRISWGCPPPTPPFPQLLGAKHASGNKGYGTKNQLVKMSIVFLGGGFKHLLFSPLFGEDSYVD